MKDREKESVKEQAILVYELAKKVDKVLSAGYQEIVVLHALCFLLGKIGTRLCDTDGEKNIYLDAIKYKIRDVFDVSQNEQNK